MTVREIGTVMDYLKAAYPRFCADTSKEDMCKILEVWSVMFADDDIELVLAAVKYYIATDINGYPPHIGAIKEAMAKIQETPQMVTQEAITLILQAVSNGLYGSEEEFLKLPPVLQKLVGTPSQLRAWSSMDVQTLQSVVASLLQKNYKEMIQHEREYTALPSDVRKIVQQINGRMISKLLPDNKK